MSGNIFELITNPLVIQKQIKIIFIFNKIEISFYKKDQMIKQIQNEIQILNTTKSNSSESKELFIKKGDTFTFQEYCPTPFQFLEISLLKQKNIQELMEEIKFK